MLGDSADAADTLERSVITVSRYLNSLHVPSGATDPSAVLKLSCHRSLQLARKRRRVELLGTVKDLAEVLRSPDWASDLEEGLFIEELARELCPVNSASCRRRLFYIYFPKCLRPLSPSSRLPENHLHLGTSIGPVQTNSLEFIQPFWIGSESAA